MSRNVVTEVGWSRTRTGVARTKAVLDGTWTELGDDTAPGMACIAPCTDVPDGHR